MSRCISGVGFGRRLFGLALLLVVIAPSAGRCEEPRVVKVLMTTGDWKSQPWYQDVWMRDKEGKPQIFRGRYIAQKVNEVAPGRFEFTDIPNYLAQQYLDADYLSQFDVLLIGDIMVHLSERFQTSVRDFVKNGGGLVYCANHKWGIGMKVKRHAFEETLPAVWPEANEWGEFQGWLDVRNFTPVILQPDHPVVKGFDWQAAPPLGGAANMPAKKEATILLATPRVPLLPWQAIGPFPNEKGAGWDTPYEPEKKVDLAAACSVPGRAELVRWHRVKARGTGTVDLNSLFEPNDNVCAYLVLYVSSPDARKVQFAGGADDGMKVWVNGALLPGDPNRNGAWPGTAPAELKPGWNEVLVKVVEDRGWWGFDLAIRTPDGKPFNDLQYSFKPESMNRDEQEFVESAPVLTAWDFGKGRAIFSASIFANDEQSEQFGKNWKDFGAYYARVLAWLAEHSQNRRAALKDVPATVAVDVDFTKPLNPIAPGIFSIHGNEGIKDTALKNYMEIRPKGAISRGQPDVSGIEGVERNGRWEQENDNDDPTVIDWTKINTKAIDAYLGECQSYGTEPILTCHGPQYGGPRWLWKDGKWIGNAGEREAAEIAEMVEAYLDHANRGKKGRTGYTLNVKYIDLGNEPDLNRDSLPGWIRIVKAVGERVRRDHPDVLIGSYCPYQMRYIRQLIDGAGQYIDWFSFHPYGWTSGEFFRFIDQIQAYARQKGYRNLKVMITEWDFWIQGRQKFDYMMVRWFDAVKRPDLLGALHYRVWQYVEPIYMFGVLWAGWGPKDVVGKAGEPIHDTYDAYWIWRNFRGQRHASTKALKTAGAPPGLLDHLWVVASRAGGKLAALLYYDWAYDGTGYKDYAKGINCPKVSVQLRMALPDGLKGRKATISRATGEGFEVVRQGIAIPDGAREFTDTIEIEPLTAYAVTVE
jgi:uncharacterized membrane protein